MKRSTEQLRSDAIRIWRAGVDAVRSDRVVSQAVKFDDNRLTILDESIPLSATGRVIVVGAGKASAAMAAEIERILQPLVESERLEGWVNVPANCVRPLARIHLHAGRPPGVNEPTPAAIDGTKEILARVASCRPDDHCLALISGGGSALLSQPAPGVSLDDKLAVTRWLSAAGATIDELNLVRRHLSAVKGGGLASVCRAGRLDALIISDVLGDSPLSIASGPTVDDMTTPEEALAILQTYGALSANIAPSAIAFLRGGGRCRPPSPTSEVHNWVIGANAVAVDAAGAEAERLGYSHAMVCAARGEGFAEDVGRQLADLAVRMRTSAGPDCLISGGEPVVKLVPEKERGRGGRNQQLVLAAFEQLRQQAATEGIGLLSGGTDGEDGPTDAAGAWLDADVFRAAQSLGLNAAAALARNDAYSFFSACGGLLKSGATNANVCDVRVVVVDRCELPKAAAPKPRLG